MTFGATTCRPVYLANTDITLAIHARFMVMPPISYVSMYFRHVVGIAVAEGREFRVRHQASELASADPDQLFMIASLEENILAPLLQ
jgi:hypothetical protein